MKKEIINYYDNLAKDYDTDRFSNSYGKYIHRQENQILSKYLNKTETELNLDVACGTGRFLKYADYGIDISNEMVKISKRKYPQKKIYVEDAENLPFKNDFFNNAISFHLFMHIDTNCMENILGEVNRVITKGGYFIFDIPSEKRRVFTRYQSSNWHGGNQISIKSLKRLIGSKWELVAFHGTAFFPLHRIPEYLRQRLVGFDSLMCNSILKEYSSHLVCILQKK